MDLSDTVNCRRNCMCILPLIKWSDSTVFTVLLLGIDNLILTILIMHALWSVANCVLLPNIPKPKVLKYNRWICLAFQTVAILWYAR